MTTELRKKKKLPLSLIDVENKEKEFKGLKVTPPREYEDTLLKVYKEGEEGDEGEESEIIEENYKNEDDRDDMDEENKKQEKKISPKQSQEQLEKIIKQFWDASPFSSDTNEFEVRFGTKNKEIKPLIKLDYDNVICKLKSLGFKCDNEAGLSLLRIKNEFTDPKTGKLKSESNTRTEIEGLSGIQEYCKTNDIEKLINFRTKFHDFKINFNKKNSYSKRNEDGSFTYSQPANFNDFNFRVFHCTEEPMKPHSGVIRGIIEKWNESKKSFRYINRVSFKHPDYPIKVDLSIIKSSRTHDGRSIMTRNMDDANLFNNPETYEIELEVINKEIGPATLVDTPELLLSLLRKNIKFILMGLQETNYPKSYPEQQEILQHYMTLIHGDEKIIRRIYPKDFIGPNSNTLQLANIVENFENSNIPNIRNNYTVTDKADGDRHLLFVSKKGEIYLINTCMKVIFTGAKTSNKDTFNSLLDGELIQHDKHGNFINLFMCFDIYFINQQDVRSFGFCKINESDITDSTQLRLPLLKSFINELNAKSVVPSDLSSPIKINSKKFYSLLGDTTNNTIFSLCVDVLEDSSYSNYNTDGLIFTPMNMGVGIDSIGKPSPNRKHTWDYSFKWKPPKYNTVDFLVTTQKNASGLDIITPIFQEGHITESYTQLDEYKTLILRVGYNQKQHGYLNPCQDVINDNISKHEMADNENDYLPVQFNPTNPYDPSAGICNIKIKSPDNQMFTESGDIFYDNTIVEFKYVLDNDIGWRWIPIKVRYDKTAEFQRGLPNFGNAYHVANSNWQSIHNPITEYMFENPAKYIPTEYVDETIYYNKTNSNKTKALRDFHNLYVKKMLIVGVSNLDDTLIDYAVGKAGDFPKWIAAKLSFVFGIDSNKDCLENHKDGACVRYLTYRKQKNNVPRALFVNGNSGYNIKSGIAMLNEKARQITGAIFGQGQQDEDKLGRGVFNQFGKAKDGFNISSCQFALHYFFENPTAFQNFMINVSECTKQNGYFIGTCYDGNVIFEKLKDKKQEESINIIDDGIKIWEIKKMYSNQKFDNDITSLGYEIQIYQESIGKMYSEFLVNFQYLNRIMENYGFRLLNIEESHHLGLPDSTGSFKDLYNFMIDEVRQNKKKQYDYGEAINMSVDEKEISFLNRYFIYKKISQIDAKTVAIELLDDTLLETERYTLSPSLKKPKAFEPLQKIIKLPKAVNLHKKIRLVPDEEVIEHDEMPTISTITVDVEEPIKIKRKYTRKAKVVEEKATVEEKAKEVVVVQEKEPEIKIKKSKITKKLVIKPDS
jgi:hypothetical protein